MTLNLRRAAIGLLLALLAGVCGAAPACPPPPDSVVDNLPPRDRGLLWRVTRDGRSSWLYGTVHVGKSAWQRFGPRTAAALRASDVLALEIDPADPALAEALGSASGPPLKLPAELQQRLDRAFERACVQPESLAGFHPLLQVTTLIVLEARWLGLDTSHAQEHLLISQARARGQPVEALETVAQQKAALLPADPGESLATLDHSLRQLENQTGRRVLTELVRAWEQGDLVRLEHFEAWCECVVTAEDRAALQRLNDERNGALAAGIVARHQAGRRVFAAVGALHMTGPQALPLLLARQGFVVERIAFGR